MRYATKMKLQQIRHQGFTLVEVLVAILILSLGILGLVALETHTLQNNQSAYYRSQATILTYDLADKMRANMAVDYWTVTASSHAGSCVSYSGAASPCSATQIAEKDLDEWNTAISNLLPAGSGNVTVSGGIVNIAIQWDDNRDGEVDSDDDIFSVDVLL